MNKTAFKLFDNEEATKILWLSANKIFFEFVDGAEKFGIESKASLNKNSNAFAASNASSSKSVKTLGFDRSFKTVSQFKALLETVENKSGIDRVTGSLKIYSR